jgi:hypothetical protein
MTKKSSCFVALPTVVYASPETKEDFDKIALEEHIHDWRPSSATTVLQNDGQEWEIRCHSKTVEASGVLAIFQWFDERPVGSAEQPAATGDTRTQPAQAASA